MSDNIDSLVLEHLRAIRAGQDELAERLYLLKCWRGTWGREKAL